MEEVKKIINRLDKVIKHNSDLCEDYQYAYYDLLDEIYKIKVEYKLTPTN